MVNNVPPKERDIAMVFQNYALYPHMTVADNMGFSLQAARRAEGRDRRSASQRAADILGLGRYLERYPRQLSGGQRQRVAMGRAIVRDPQVFLFDEPLSNLDAKLRVQMRTEIKELHQRLKTTTVYVTHDQIEAMTMADKIVVMHDGLVEQIGAPLELYDRPDNLFVAGFIGSPAMNFAQGHGARERHGSIRRAGRHAPAARSARRTAATAGRRSTASGPSISCIADDGAEAEVAGRRADRLGDAGRREARRRGHHRRVPRAPPIQAGRQDPAQTRSAARSSVRRRHGTTTEPVIAKDTREERP